MSIIDDTYFTDWITLPTDNPNYLNKLQIYIDRAERDYLMKALGYELYTLFEAELPTPTTQRYIDILEGKEFTNNCGNLDKWQGLNNAEYRSFLAYFTFFYYLKGEQSKETGNGTTSNMWENAERVAPIMDQVTAYAEAVKNYNKLCDFMLANESDYPEWHFTSIERRNFLNI